MNELTNVTTVDTEGAGTSRSVPCSAPAGARLIPSDTSIEGGGPVSQSSGWWPSHDGNHPDARLRRDVDDRIYARAARDAIIQGNDQRLHPDAITDLTNANYELYRDAYVQARALAHYRQAAYYLIDEVLYAPYVLAAGIHTSPTTGLSSDWGYNMYVPGSGWRRAINRPAGYYSKDEQCWVAHETDEYYHDLRSRRTIIKHLTGERNTITYPCPPRDIYPTARHLHLDIDYHGSAISGADVAYLESLGMLVYPTSRQGVHAILVLRDHYAVETLRPIVEQLSHRLTGIVDRTNLDDDMAVPTLTPKSNADPAVSAIAARRIMSYLNKTPPLADLTALAVALEVIAPDPANGSPFCIGDTSPSNPLYELRSRIQRALRQMAGDPTMIVPHDDWDDAPTELNLTPRNIPTGTFWQAVQDHHIIPRNLTVDDVPTWVRSISQGVPEPRIQDRITTTTAYVTRWARQPKTELRAPWLTDNLIATLWQTAVDAYPANHKTDPAQLYTARLYIATTIFLHIFRSKVDPTEHHLTQKIMMQMTGYLSDHSHLQYSSARRLFARTILSRITNIVATTGKVYKVYANQKYPINTFQLTELGKQLSDMIPTYENKLELAA